MQQFDVTCIRCSKNYQGELRGIDKPVCISMECVCGNTLVYTTFDVYADTPMKKVMREGELNAIQNTD